MVKENQLVSGGCGSGGDWKRMILFDMKSRVSELFRVSTMKPAKQSSIVCVMVQNKVKFTLPVDKLRHSIKRF